MGNRKVLKALAISMLLFLGSCGGGGGSDNRGGHGADTVAPDISTESKPTQTEAARMLGQATFGPNMAAIEPLTTVGYTAWFEEQFGKPQRLHRSHMDAMLASGVA